MFTQLKIFEICPFKALTQQFVSQQFEQPIIIIKFTSFYFTITRVRSLAEWIDSISINTCTSHLKAQSHL